MCFIGSNLTRNLRVISQTRFYHSFPLNITFEQHAAEEGLPDMHTHLEMKITSHCRAISSCANL
jgi:hypothetical protein